jgi:aminobenzoyl-glutamate transport protein
VTNQPSSNPPTVPAASGLLGAIERLGNKLPDPVFLFIGLLVLVIGVSAAGSALGWSVQPVRPRVVMESDGAGGQRPKLDDEGRPVIELADSGDPVTPRSLVTREGVYWMVANMVRNFVNFAPLGVVLVSVLGIGVAEKVGLFAALMRYLASIVPPALLTPMVLFLGMLSHLASDAGYIILPPLAAALYAAAGRPPVAGIAAAFAGVAGGFAANLFIASSDALIAPLTERAARMLEPHYAVLPTANWYFLAASTPLLVVTGWFITSRIVEPRLRAAEATRPEPVAAGVGPVERRGLLAAGVAAVITLSVLAALLFAPGAPMSGTMPAPAPTYGPIPVAIEAAAAKYSPETGAAELHSGSRLAAESSDGTRGTVRVKEGEVSGTFEPLPAPQPRWSQAIVPCIFFAFVVPGLVYGVVTGGVKTQADVTKAFVDAMAGMAPVIVMAFFAAQFIEAFRFSHLDAMIANIGGKSLAAADLPKPLLLIAVIGLVIVLDVLIASMSAKWTAMAPILVPMLMMAGLSPELTQVAYRIGDSVVNVVTPLNSYIIVILAVLQRYRSSAGMGNLIALMTPYSIGFAIVWTVFLLGWVMLDLPLGPKAELWYVPGHH